MLPYEMKKYQESASNNKNELLSEKYLINNCCVKKK